MPKLKVDDASEMMTITYCTLKKNDATAQMSLQRKFWSDANWHEKFTPRVARSGLNYGFTLYLYR